VRIATEPSQGHLASVNLLVTAGSSRESVSNNGVANLLAEANRKAVASKVAGFGGTLSGYTDREHTHYNVLCSPEHVSAAVAALGEVVHSVPSKESVEAARAEILAERRAIFNVVNKQVVMDFLHSSAYQNTPLAHTARGEIKVIKNLTQEDLASFQKASYLAHNIIVSATGAIDSKFDELANDAFSAIPQPTYKTSFSSGRRVDYTGSLMAIRDDTVHDIQVAFAYETFPLSHPHAITASLLTHLIGSWDSRSPTGSNSSTRLGEVLATQNLATRYNAFYKPYHGSGLFGVYASSQDDEKLDDLVYAIFNEYQKLYDYVTPDDLQRAKTHLKFQLVQGEAATQDRARVIGKQICSLTRRVPLAELFERIDEVTLCDLRELLGTYFNDVEPVAVAHGNLENMLDYSGIRAWTYWNRW